VTKTSKNVWPSSLIFFLSHDSGGNFPYTVCTMYNDVHILGTLDPVQFQI
jgi:hypothetical protein